jgi:hypothetical protein
VAGPKPLRRGPVALGQQSHEDLQSFQVLWISRIPSQWIYPEGVSQHSPGSRPKGAHPGVPGRNSFPTLKGLHNVGGISAVEPFQGSQSEGTANPGCATSGRDPGLCCIALLGHGPGTYAELGTTDLGHDAQASESARNRWSA